MNKEYYILNKVFKNFNSHNEFVKKHHIKDISVSY